MNSLLSVIIPIYNVQEYLKQCVESVINQKYQDLEIILVDDGSTDGCKEIVDIYAKRDTRVRVIHKKNGGLLSARAAGVELAKGQYVTFVDGDDWVDACMYERLMGRLMKDRADLITSGCYRYFNDAYIVESYDRMIPEGVYEKKRLETDVYPIMMYDERINAYAFDPSTCFKIFRKELLFPIMQKLKRCHFYYGEDAAISYLYVLDAQRVICTNDKYYFHRQRNEAYVPSYFNDELFFEKLLECYEFIKGEIKNSQYYEIINKQLDLFFARSANLKRMKYGLPIYYRLNYFLFPFDSVPCGSNIVLYGAGKVGRDYQMQLQNAEGWSLVARVDRNYESMGNGVQSPEVILEVDFDYIVVAIVDDEVYATIKKWLNTHGINDEKIIHKIYRCSL